jgi:hypothetical protein
MSNKLRDLMKRAEHWPEGAQEEAVASLQAIEEELVGLYELSPGDRAALERSDEDVRLGRFASEEQVSEVFGRYRRA